MTRRAIILFGHGSRDPDWAAPMEALRAQLRAQLPGTDIELAFLELMKPGLAEAVGKLVDRNAVDMTVVPVFLAQGSHVKHDLPALVETLRHAYPERSISVTPSLGEQPEVIAAISACIARMLGS